MEHPLRGDSEVDVTLFVPCYNEEGNILPTLQKIVEAGRQVRCSYEIIVIDDASCDRSAELVQRFQEANPDLTLTLVRNPVNRGWAQNYTEAAFLGRGRYYRTVCGDNVEPVSTQVAILSHLGEADLIIPYPIQVQNKTWFRRLLSRTYTSIVNVITGKRLRYWNGCALVSRQDVIRWHPPTRGFGFQAWLVSRLLTMGHSYVEVGGIYNERPSGKSHALTFKNLVSVAHTLLSIFLERLSRSFCCESASNSDLMAPGSSGTTRSQEFCEAAKEPSSVTCR